MFLFINYRQIKFCSTQTLQGIGKNAKVRWCQPWRKKKLLQSQHTHYGHTLNTWICVNHLWFIKINQATTLNWHSNHLTALIKQLIWCYRYAGTFYDHCINACNYLSSHYRTTQTNTGKYTLHTNALHRYYSAGSRWYKRQIVFKHL